MIKKGCTLPTIQLLQKSYMYTKYIFRFYKTGLIASDPVGSRLNT